MTKGKKRVLQWQANCEELCDFKDYYGHCNVAKSHEKKALLFWVQSQRRMYKKRQLDVKGQLTDERFQVLEDIGFVWQPRVPSNGTGRTLGRPKSKP